jgi:hypothetical protein
MELDEVLRLRVSQAEMVRYKAAAHTMGQKSLSRFVRDGLKRVCELVEKDRASQQQADPIQPDLDTDVPAENREVVGTSIGKIYDQPTLWKSKMRRCTDTHWEDDDGSWKPF